MPNNSDPSKAIVSFGLLALTKNLDPSDQDLANTSPLSVFVADELAIMIDFYSVQSAS